MPKKDILDRTKDLVSRNRYRIRIHAVRHMIEEGFSEKDVISSILGESSIIEHYENDCRCLVLGHFLWGNKRKSPLHVVCDYSAAGVVDIVTAYIPQKPWWISSKQRGKKQ